MRLLPPADDQRARHLVRPSRELLRSCSRDDDGSRRHVAQDDGAAADVDLADAVDLRQALRLGVISFDAVKMLLLARLENRPVRLDLTLYPHLPAATVETTDPRAYLGLIAGSGSFPSAESIPA